MQDAGGPTHNPFSDLCVLDYIRQQEPPDCFTVNGSRLDQCLILYIQHLVNLKLLHSIFSSVFFNHVALDLLKTAGMKRPLIT